VKEVKEEVKAAKEEVVPVSEVKATPERQEFKVLDKIDLSQIEGNRNRPAKKDKPKTEEVKATAKPAEPAKETPKPVEKPVEKVEEKKT